MNINEQAIKRIFSQNLNDLLREKDITQKEIAQICEVSTSAVSTWCLGLNIPRMDKIERLANHFNLPKSYFLEAAPSRTEKHGKAVKIPVLGYVPAGVPIEAVQEVLDWEEITPEMARHGDFFALHIKGDSMAPELRDGDIVIIRQQPDISSGDIGVVMVNSEDATVKRVIKHDNGISIVPINPLYAPQYFSNEEIDSLPVRIIGAVVECRRKYQRI